MGPSFISDIGIAILASAIFGLIFHKLKLPLITGYIAAGIFLGNAMGIGKISNPHNVEMLSEIGFILLMFTLGLDIDLRKLKQAGKNLLITGVAQVALSFFLIYAFFYYSHLSEFAGSLGTLYIAMAASLSSTVIIVKTISDRMELGILSSRLTIGVAILQDVFAILFLAFQPSYSNLEFSIIIWSFAKIMVLVGISYFLARFSLPYVFNLVEQRPELIIITALAWCFAMVSFSHALHLSKEMGALIAGVSIASLPYHADISSKLLTLRDFFITLFFVALGLQLPVPTTDEINCALLVTALVYVTRFISVMPILCQLKYGARTAFTTTINLAQVSEFAIILITLGMKYNHIENTLLNAFIWAFVLTSFLSSIVMPNYDRIFIKLSWLFEKFMEIKENEVQLAEPTAGPSITFLAINHTTSSILRRLEETHSSEYLKQIQIIANNPEMIRTLIEKDFEAHYADLAYPSTFSNFRIDQSKIIICSVGDTMLRGINNLALLKQVKRMAPKSFIVTTAETIGQAQAHYQAGASYVILPRAICASYVVDVIEKLSSGEAENIRKNAIDFVNNLNEVLP